MGKDGRYIRTKYFPSNTLELSFIQLHVHLDDGQTSP